MKHITLIHALYKTEAPLDVKYIERVSECCETQVNEAMREAGNACLPNK